jgi:hypothetical protein
MQTADMSSATRFSWRTWDVNSLLPLGWQAEIIAVVDRYARERTFETNTFSREGDADNAVKSLAVSNARVRVELSWLEAMYEGLFRELTQLTTDERVSAACKESHRPALNAHRGAGMRHECHVDSNPKQALLYVTDHPKGSGGELVVSNRPDATGISEVDEDCSVIYPVAGNLVVFDARRFPHYVRPLRVSDQLRVVAAMNYYVPSCPEACGLYARPLEHRGARPT